MNSSAAIVSKSLEAIRKFLVENIENRWKYLEVSEEVSEDVNR